MSSLEKPISPQSNSSIDCQITDSQITNNQITESQHAVEPNITDRMELLAEQVDIQVEKHTTGSLLVKKVVREQTVHIPVVLTEEVLVIEYQQTTEPADSSDDSEHTTRIQLNGETITLRPNQSIELPVYREEAVIHKKTVVTEQVDIGKITQHHTTIHVVTLRHEELEIDEQHHLPE
ncbi:MAG: DUF2382 domain-containing protein [Moraxellaceae bacterium]|nr:MAG: DUF2382 domain-containing protein [Moraxellaceae bacterium]